MKAALLVVLLTLHTVSPLWGQTKEEVIASLGLLQMEAGKVQEFVSCKLMVGASPEFVGKMKFEYVRSGEGKQSKLIISHRGGDVTSVSWWFDGETLSAEKLAELQRSIAFELRLAGFELTKSSAGVGQAALFGELMMTPSTDEAVIVTTFTRTETRTLAEFQLELPLLGRKGESRPALWVYFHANTVSVPSVTKD